MKNKKALPALCLALCLALGCLPAPAAAAELTGGAEEVIYAALDADGAPARAWAVVSLDPEGGAAYYGDFTELKNLTDTTALAYADGRVAIESGADPFYFQGELAAFELPWLVDIRYTLDGRSVEAGALGGASGLLEIAIETRRNPAADAAFFENYLLQVTVTLDAALCGALDAPGATVASAGGDRTVAFTVLPGQEGALSLSVEVEDFRMDGITLAALPYDTAAALGDAAELTDGLDTLADAVSQLAEGAAALSDGAASLRYGAYSFGEGLGELSGGSAALVSGSQAVADALAQLAGALAGGGEAGGSLDLTALAQLPAGLRQASEGLAQTAQGMAQLAEGYAAAYPALAAAVEAIPAPTVGEAELAALAALAPGNAALAALVESYQAAQAVRAVWAQTQTAFAAVNESLPALAAAVETVAASLEQTAAQLEAAMQAGAGVDLTALAQLAEGLSALSAQYGELHAGLVAYTGGVDALAEGWTQVSGGVSGLAGGASELAEGAGELDEAVSELPGEVDALLGADGEAFTPRSFLDARNRDVAAVQFVLTTAAIEPPEPEPEPVGTQEEPGFFAQLWERLLDLFR